MRYHFLIFVLFMVSIGFSQEKKYLYYNENLELITQKEYSKKLNDVKYLDLYFGKDSVVTCMLVQRKKFGKLNDIEFSNLKNAFLSDSELSNELIVIVYYPGIDECNQSGNWAWVFYDDTFNKKMKKISPFHNLLIYKDNSGLIYNLDNKVAWQKDTNQMVEKLFFKYHYPCYSFVVIDKSGRFIAYFGEFDTSTLVEISKEVSKFGK